MKVLLINGSPHAKGSTYTALNEVAVTDYYTSSEATVMAIEAGVDMILMPDSYEEAYYGLLAEVLEGNIAKLKARYPEGFDTERSVHREA